MEFIRASWEDIPEDWKDKVPDNGCGKEDAGYLIIKEGGKISRIFSDAMEPEDASFGRDLSWICDLLKEVYAMGVKLKRRNKVDKDRTAICNIISEMLDNPDEYGIYPTSTAYAKLERYVEKVRTEAIGWMHAEACVCMDKGRDPRHINVPEMLDRAKHDLGD